MSAHSTTLELRLSERDTRRARSERATEERSKASRANAREREGGEGCTRDEETKQAATQLDARWCKGVPSSFL